MQREKAQAIVSKYTAQTKKILLLLFVITYLTVGIVFWRERNFIFLAASPLFVWIARKIIIYFLYYRRIFSILQTDLEPQLFKAAIEHGKVFHRSGIERVLAAYYSGDYQTVVNICVHQITNKNLSKFKYHYLAFLACSYFELRDFKKLRLVCEEFTSAPERVQKRFPVMQFYACFLDGAFDCCMELCQTEKRAPANAKLSESRRKFNYAVVCYTTGDREKAKQHFESVITHTPNLNFATLSKKYIETIDNSEALNPTFPEILPNYEFVMPTRAKGVKIYNRIILLLAIALLMFGVFLQVAITLYHKKDTSLPIRTEYKIPPHISSAIFGLDPDSFLQTYCPWYDYCEDFRQHAEIDEAGNLILRLTEDQKNAFLQYRDSGLETIEKMPGVAVAKDYTSITITGNSAEVMDFLYYHYSFYSIPDMACRQLFAGKDPATISVTFTIVDKANGQTVYTATWPNELIYISFDDLHFSE